MVNRIRALVLAVVAALGITAAPAAAAFNPTYTLTYQAPGIPGVGRFVSGYITFGASDTYVTGGLTVTPQNLGGQVAITAIIINSPVAQYEAGGSLSPSGSASLLLYQQIQGTSEVLATATTATVTVAGTTGANVLTANTPVFCQLDDAATGGGGSGTWTTTYAVSSCKYASATTFTITTTGAAPTGGGNFTYFIPTLQQQAPSGANIASFVVPFSATVL